MMSENGNMVNKLACNMIIVSLLMMFTSGNIFSVLARAAEESDHSENTENLPELSTSIEPSEATIGDEILFTISVSSLSTRVEMPDLFESLENGKIQVKDRRILRGADEKGKRLKRRDTWVLVPFSTGKLNIAPQKVRLLDGTRETLLLTPTMEILVKSVLPQGATATTEIMAIKSPMGYQGSLTALARTLLYLLITGLFFWIIYMLYRRYTKIKEFVEPPVPAHEEAFRSLQIIERKGMVDKGSAKPLYLELSAIMRRYLGRQFKIQALEATTDEILEALRKVEFKEDVIPLVEELLQTSDLAKWAKEEPHAGERRASFNSARNIVDLTWHVNDESEQEEVEDVNEKSKGASQ